ncbi:HD domain-containing phosphohydrolase [Botrimarina sp.]|uniref:HD-GYP domain-containing protein n=1 Tax=Botrimarina sp. TaxID=2795802 RepID=UPI0032EF4734
MPVAPLELDGRQPAGEKPDHEAELLARLESAFRQVFAVVEPEAGVLERVTPDWPRVDVFQWLGVCEEVARRGRAEVIWEHSPLMLLAVSLSGAESDKRRVAVAVLLTDPAPSREAIDSAASAFGVDPEFLRRWCAGRRSWPPHAALPLAEALVEACSAKHTATVSKRHLSDVSAHLLATFEELHLLHQLTEGLWLGRSEHELAEQAVRRLADIVPADCIVARLAADDTPEVLMAGRRLPLEEESLDEFFRGLGPQVNRRAVVLNRNRTTSPTWGFPEVREVVAAPLIAAGRVVGHLAAVNYRPDHRHDEGGFGSVEASLLSSVATLIGVHASNRGLFKEKYELFKSSVHALTSAIDAKDPYTCGHSDRVARISVRIARELGCTDDQLNTLYLGGLLHDVGKIGIDDRVLGKPEHLTDEEFEHIKQHPVLGERILAGVPQLAHVLPIVRSHHECWDGSGYPDGLVADECPLVARIAAVADAIDAMGSDRPYRHGMPIEEVENVLREGAGRQWDRRVVDAYFAARDDIMAISRVEREPLDLDVGRWQPSDAFAFV